MGMKNYLHEVQRLKIFCSTEGCTSRTGSQKSAIRNVRDFSKKSKLEAIESFKDGIRINATHGNPTQEKWKLTARGWLCSECK